MYYNEGTGSYVNDEFEPIYETGYYFGIPYKINREKFEIVMQKYGEKPRVKDADVLVFNMHYNIDDDTANPTHYAFFATPKNSPDGSDDFYECIQFSYLWDENDKTCTERFIEFVHEFMECVIGVSVGHLNEMKDEKVHELSVIDRQIMLIDEILKENNRK